MPGCDVDGVFDERDVTIAEHGVDAAGMLAASGDVQRKVAPIGGGFIAVGEAPPAIVATIVGGRRWLYKLWPGAP